MVLILSVLIGIALDFAGAKPAVKYYASKYDHIDLEAILNNRRLVNYYSACLLSEGVCPPEGVEFKRILPEALQTNCGRCSEKQATAALRAVRRLKKEYPKVWFQLSERWDPDDIYVKKFESTFGSRTVISKPPLKDQPLVLNRFDGGDDDSTNNNIGESLPLATTNSHQDQTTHKVITATNSIPLSFTVNTSTKSDYPSELTPLVSTAKTITAKPSTTSRPITTTSKTSTTKGQSTTISSPSNAQRITSTTARSSTSTRLPIIPGFIPINTFFTNPSIPLRPINNLNIGVNIGATVSGLVRGLGAIGTRVMETGADIADIVIKNLARPLQV